MIELEKAQMNLLFHSTAKQNKKMQGLLDWTYRVIYMFLSPIGVVVKAMEGTYWVLCTNVGMKVKGSEFCLWQIDRGCFLFSCNTFQLRSLYIRPT